MKIQHFVITRFNIPFIRKENIDFLFSEEYLSERFDIFERFCFQSLKNQICQNFTWLVLFDSRTPDRFRELNSKWHQEWDSYVPVYIDMQELESMQRDGRYVREACRCAHLARNGYEAVTADELNYEDLISRVLLPHYLDSIIRKMIDPDTDYIITSRIDNDDCYEMDMITNVQKLAVLDNVDKILNFDNGLQYVEGKNICQSFYYPNGHFTSIIEPIGNPFMTIIYWEHYFIDRYKDVMHIKTKPLWMEILHGSNAVNTLKLNPENHLLWNVDLAAYGLKYKWGVVKTFLSLFVHFESYLWPKVKKFFVYKF